MESLFGEATWTGCDYSGLGYRSTATETAAQRIVKPIKIAVISPNFSPFPVGRLAADNGA